MNYLDRARQLGQDVEALQRGETITSHVTFATIEEFKNFFGAGLTEEQRTAFSLSAPSDGDTGTGLNHPRMRNLTHYVYGNRALTAEDTEYATQIFPVRVAVTSGNQIVINSDQVVGPAASPYSINAGTLVFSGGSLTVITTSLYIKADNLLTQHGGKEQYLVGILGQQGRTGDVGGNGEAYKNPAKNGSNASAPTPGICTGASDGGKGDDGKEGNQGGNGGKGDNGHSNLPASISIGAVDPASQIPFVVFTMSGPGGNGGNGGDGGQGQDGGDGGHGCDSGAEGTDGGNGGNAGKGGLGGNGGDGGDAVDGQGISITFPNASKSILQTLPQAAQPGQGGNPGKGGSPGSPGKGGSGGKHKSDGSEGSGASSGDDGKPGNASQKTGAPGQFVINYT
ncbi:MAG: hypothetical protein KDK30_03930 [Leptospiraceae bacterium]|nr:hypothetical protein [Leptospiraceae bacterium]